MRLINASLLLVAGCLRAADPLCSPRGCATGAAYGGAKKDGHGKHARLFRFLIKYGNQGPTNSMPFAIPFNSYSKTEQMREKLRKVGVGGRRSLHLFLLAG